MTEYVNKAELIKACNYTVCYEDDEETFGISEARIDLMPTIAVVHCGECKHGRSYFVNRWACEHPQHKKQWRNTNWFCADGERK